MTDHAFNSIVITEMEDNNMIKTTVKVDGMMCGIDVPSGLPYGRSYALLSYALRLRIKERRHDGYSSCEGVSQKHRHHRHDRHAGDKGDSYGNRQGASQNCRHHRHRCHPKGSYPPKKGR